MHASTPAGTGLCLGIDVGGTFTDVVLMDLVNSAVLGKAKAPTTKWDPSLGISEALDRFDADGLDRCDLVALSTTLATNAIVEGRGQPVGLLIMPPYGRLDPDNFTHTPRAIIAGQMDIDGTELVPINPDQVRRTAHAMLDHDAVAAFAVAGYAGHANPAHELAVKEILQAETGRTVTCGYEITEGLNYRIRAETAALNARIIPYLDRLIRRVRHSLEAHRVRAPLMVVRSDGSLVSMSVALERPILTILSGPAASVAGARHLARCPEAAVVDMGGTTTDMAIVKGGDVPLCADGARVGGWQTHVPALDMRTVGLGGDSRILILRGVLSVGPQRVAPAGWLMARDPGMARALAWVEQNAGHFDTATGGAEFLVRLDSTAPAPAESLTDQEKAILDLLAEGPLSLHEIASRLNSVTWHFINTDTLENRCLVQRCGLTPTDLLQAEGRLNLFGVDASRRLTALYARLQKQTPADFIRTVLDRMTRYLAREILQTYFDRDGHGLIEQSPPAMALLDNALSGDPADWRVSVSVKHPIIGVGAPAGLFVPGAARLLGTDAIIPEHADVANAVGAAISSVRVVKRVHILVDETGTHRVEGLPRAPRFRELAAAQQFAEQELRRLVQALAAETGADASQVEIVTSDQTARIATADSLFIQRTVEVRLTGRPAPARPGH